MKHQILFAILLSGILFNSAAFGDIYQKDSEHLACCLADEWKAETTSTSLSKQPSSKALAQSDDIICCLASEWTIIAQPVIADVSNAKTVDRHDSDEFCCIADEWKLN